MTGAHDTALVNGRVVTLDGGSRIVQALGLRDGRIAAVGSDAEIRQRCAPATRVVDLAGATVTPGFFDAHPHMDRLGLRRRAGLEIAHCRSVAEIVETIADAARRTPPGEWIVTLPMGAPPMSYVFSPDQLAEGRFPTAADLDRATTDHPVYIRAPWGWWSRKPFPSVANSTALALAGVDRHAVAPHNTEIVRDAADEPTGLFLDRNYTPVLEYTLFQVVPRFTYEDRIAAVRHGAAATSALGVTAAYEGHGLTPTLIDAYRAAHAKGDLSLRMQIPLSLPTAAFDDGRIIDMLHHWADALRDRGSGDAMLRIEGICLDVGDPQIAALIARHYPYEQWAGHFYQSLPHERLVRIGVAAARLGLRLNCLVCYDLERVLRAYEAIDREVSIRDRRWVIIHVIDATDEQIARIKALGLIATVTPTFMHMASDRFGLDRLRERGIPIRRLLDAGVPVALSTDGVPPSMLFALWQALGRHDGDSGTALGESHLSREEALRLATCTGHLLTWSEGDRGPLAVGRSADLVVLDQDPLTCPLDAIKEIGVRRTFVGGRQVHGPA